MRRAAGVLLHPTSLPGAGGIGDLGATAERFVDWLVAAGQTYWQVLPLGPPGESASPYDCFSAFAGNPLLISLQQLADDGWLASGSVAPDQDEPGRVDFAAVRAHKGALLRRVWSDHRANLPADIGRRFVAFREDPAVADWLEDWTLYAALKEQFGGAPWNRWPLDLRRREPTALAAARRELENEIDYHRFLQCLVFDQWSRLRLIAAKRGLQLFGDLAIYVALDSADVWSNQDLFDLDEDGRPLSVAGVPPDYFSKTGQLWGNPLYRWEQLEARSYDWWIRRLGWSLRLADLVRLDHFRGFAGYWEVPAGEKTAVNGRWRPGPGAALFDTARQALGDLPLVAEDLGIITDDVRRLRRNLGFPGMRVLQFAFDEVTSDHLPHRVPGDTVIYSGTHDNNTARGWFASAGATVRHRALDYLGGTSEEIAWSMLRGAFTSVADIAIAPLQDILDLDSSARMNEPGQGHGQWSWRLEGLPSEESAARLRRLTEVSGRFAGSHRNA